MKFTEKLRELREKAGLSEAKLAQASGLPFGTVHGYGLGARKPSLAAALRIAKALGVTCDAFADCEDLVGKPEEPEKKPGGRPRKQAVGAGEKAKRPRGRPRKSEI